MHRPLDYIMVPKGAELNAVRKGLSATMSATIPRPSSSVQIIALPAGPQPVSEFLDTWCHQHQHELSSTTLRILMMGLCGSLVPHHQVGDIVLYDRCLDGRQEDNVPDLRCDHDYSATLRQMLDNSVTCVTGLMCDRVISQAALKRSLAQQHPAQVVDMESFSALSVFQNYGVSAAVLRVVSDDVVHDLPDLNQAFDTDGNIQPLELTRCFLAQPVGAYHLIRGSLSALKRLEMLARQLISKQVMNGQ